MKLVSWNVNGIRAILKKWFIDYLKKEQPDVIGLQEIKGNESQIDKNYLEEILSLGYELYFNPAQRPGYSGTAIFTKIHPLKVIFWIDTSGLKLDTVETDEVIEENHEGRVITAEFEDYYYVVVYTPNSKSELERLAYRQIWDHVFLVYMKHLEKTKPVIFCGDLNVAHREIDLKNPKANKGTNGFTEEERSGIENYIQAGFIDTFRHFYPDLIWAYSRWSYLGNARKNNSGWRIDYFLSSWSLAPRLHDSFIRSEVVWSDHCPVGILLK